MKPLNANLHLLSLISVSNLLPINKLPIFEITGFSSSNIAQYLKSFPSIYSAYSYSLEKSNYSLDL